MIKEIRILGNSDLFNFYLFQININSTMEKVKRFLVFTGILFMSIQGFGQATVDNSGPMIMLYKNGDKAVKGDDRGYYVGPHVLGEDMTELINDFEATYTYYVESGGAYSTKQKRIEKPVIYKSIKRLIKHYNKVLKKSPESASTIDTNLTNVLEIGLKLMKVNSTVVETSLRSLKSPSEIEKYLLNLRFAEQR